MERRAGRPTNRRRDDLDERAATIAAFAHPVRLQLLSLLTGADFSAAEAAREIGTTQANASYHLRRLLDAGLVELVGEVVVRGGIARRYRHVPGSTHGLATSGLDDHVLLAAALASELQRRTRLRQVGVRGAMTDAELWIDEAAWAEALAGVTHASDVLHQRAVAPRTPGAFRVSATISLFRMHPEDGAEGSR